LRPAAPLGSGASSLSISKSINRFAADTMNDAAHAMELLSREDVNDPIIARQEVALMRGIKVYGNCRASTTWAITSILQAGASAA
jgi:hypothetical protein